MTDQHVEERLLAIEGWLLEDENDGKEEPSSHHINQLLFRSAIYHIHCYSAATWTTILLTESG